MTEADIDAAVEHFVRDLVQRTVWRGRERALARDLSGRVRVIPPVAALRPSDRLRVRLLIVKALKQAAADLIKDAKADGESLADERTRGSE